MSLIKHIPNTITCLNLFSGCMSVVAAANADLHAAFLWIVSAAIFDFMDGFAARLLKAYSPMGKELDSLSDVVSFGVAPGMIVYALFSQAAMQLQLQGNWAVLLPLFAFVIPVFSGLRLGATVDYSILMTGRLRLSSDCPFRRMLYSGVHSPIPYKPGCQHTLPGCSTEELFWPV